MAQTVHVAMIGCGNMARQHLGPWRALARKGVDFEFVGLADPVRVLAEGFQKDIAAWQPSPVPVYADWRQMLTDVRPDAVDICTPHDQHHTIGIACLQAGVDVIIEKPLGVSLRAAKALVETAKAHGRVLGTAEQVRFWVGPRAVAWAAGPGGLLGSVREVVVHLVGGGGRQEVKGPMPWRLERMVSGGGVMIDVGVHYCDLLLRTLGPAKRVTAYTKTFQDAVFADGRRPTVEDAASIMIEMDNGTLVTWVMATPLPGQPVRTNAYYGTEGAITAEGLYPTAPRFTSADGSSMEPEAFLAAYLKSLNAEERERLYPAAVTADPLHHPSGPHTLGIELEFYAFLEAVRGVRPLEMDGEAGVGALALAEAILESGHLGGVPVNVADVMTGEVDGYQRPIDAALGLV